MATPIDARNGVWNPTVHEVDKLPGPYQPVARALDQDGDGRLSEDEFHSGKPRAWDEQIGRWRDLGAHTDWLPENSGHPVERFVEGLFAFARWAFAPLRSKS